MISTRWDRHQPIEGGRFTLGFRENACCLLRCCDNQVLGWIHIGNQLAIHGVAAHPIEHVQVLPAYSRTIAVLLLINAVRMVLQRPLYFDGKAFAECQSLIYALSQKPNFPDVYAINRTSGARVKYKTNEHSLDCYDGILFDRTHLVNSMRDHYPGGSREIVMSLFEEFHAELLVNVQ